jgi:uncharacterized protein (DUF111 family)
MAEFEDLRARAAEAGVPIREVERAALREAESSGGSDPAQTGA